MMNSLEDLPCLSPSPATDTPPIWPLRPADLAGFLATRSPPEAAFLRATGFAAAPGELVLLPGGSGIAGCAFGLGAAPALQQFGDLPGRLPAGSVWRLAPACPDAADALLGFCLGAYRFGAFRAARRATARLVPPDLPPAQLAAVLEQARAAWMVRDLINRPANDLGPAELADAATALVEKFGGRATRIGDAALAADWPTVAAVGAGSVRPPLVVRLDWRGPGVGDDAPLVALCGKGVCFDTGGYDLKPSSGMLRMKKDMGGAAIALGIARLVMAANLPVRLAVWLGCVENSVSGQAMRPLDVLRTRRGITVEVGNTDAEGRLVLCDLLDAACAESPSLLVDLATLTGAARAALGPDLPALFCNDEKLAADLLAAGTSVADPLWRLPLWDGYDAWLESPVADMTNVSSRPFAGAIIGALFLRRFVAADTAWAHLDVYAWNDQTRPGRPEGGEAQAMRAVFQAIRTRHGVETA